MYCSERFLGKTKPCCYGAQLGIVHKKSPKRLGFRLFISIEFDAIFYRRSAEAYALGKPFPLASVVVDYCITYLLLFKSLILCFKRVFCFLTAAKMKHNFELHKKIFDLNY